MAILVILAVSIGVSDLLSKSYRNKASSLNGQLAFVSASDEKKGSEVIEYNFPSQKKLLIFTKARNK